MHRILIACIALLFPLCPVNAKDDSFQQYQNYELPHYDTRSPLGNSGYWRGWIELESESWGRYCYAESLVAAARPIRLFFRSSWPRFYVRTIPKLKTRNEVVIHLAFTHHPKHSPVLTVGKEEFPLITQEKYAFLRDPATQEKLIAAMRKNQKLFIRGIAADGTKTEDEYELRGAPEMLEAMQKECPL